MNTLKQLQEKGEAELNKLIPKENDLIFDTYENPLCSSQAILNILHQQTTLVFEAGKAEAIAMMLKEIEEERYNLGCGYGNCAFTTDETLTRIKTKLTAKE